jgi:putative NADH-flavin reductase
MAIKKLLVLGATGGTGQQVVLQALQHGHEVTVFVRSPERLTSPRDRVRVITGSLPEDADALAGAVGGQDAVISALGRGGSLKASGLFASSMPVIVGAMERHGVRRLIVTSAYGVGNTYGDVPLVARILIRVLLRDLYADKQASEETLFRSNLDWTVVYPVTLTNGPTTGVYRVGEHLALRGLPRISRADVANCLLRQVDDRRYLKKGVLVSY